MINTAASVAVTAAVITRAQAADNTACTALVRSYKAQGATVPEMQAYSLCVGVLYPEPTPASVGVDLIILKGVVLLIFLGTVAGGIWMSSDEYPGRATNIVLGLLMGAVATACGLAALALVFLGVKFLFS